LDCRLDALSRAENLASVKLGIEGQSRPRRKLGVEVEYRQRLKDGLRRAVLKGIRPEK